MPLDIVEISEHDDLYPPLLAQITDFPKKLYVRGNVELLQEPTMLAVVGSRKANAYGKQAIEKVLTPVIEAGIPIVSGLAFGVDSLAHRACVAQGAPTIAVLGSGIDIIQPTSHTKLAQEILKAGGAIVSEYPVGTPASKHRFPERNRIIAGLSRATLIIQAAERSGSLITARLAAEYNRDVCAIPGHITDPISRGTNKLIRDGAAPILEPQDLFDILGVDQAETKQQKEVELADSQATVFEHLSHTPQHVDEITDLVKLPAEQVAATLLDLELDGHVTHVGGMRYVRKS